MSHSSGMVWRNLTIVGCVIGLGGCVATVPPPEGGAVSSYAYASPRAVEVAPVPILPERESVYFDADSTVISNESWEVLHNVAHVVRMNRDLSIRLIGRTDRKQNAALARRRAIAIHNALSQLGLNPDRIMIDNETGVTTGKRPRRVDILIVPVTGAEEI